MGGAVKARWMFQFNPGVNPIDPGAAAHTAQVPGYNSRYKVQGAAVSLLPAANISRVLCSGQARHLWGGRSFRWR